MDEIQKSIDRLIARPQPAAARRAPKEVEGFFTEKESHILGTTLTLYKGAIEVALACFDRFVRLDPDTISVAEVRQFNQEFCRTLDLIEDLQPLVDADTKLMASFIQYKMNEQRLIDACDDELFECEIKLTLLGA